MDGIFWSFWGWGLIGAISFLTTLPSLMTSTPNEASAYWRPQGPSAQAAILRRAKRALSAHNWVHAWPWFLPSLAVCTVMLAMSWRGNAGLTVVECIKGVLGMLLGFGLAASVSYPLGLGKTLRTFRQGVAALGAKMLARLGDPQEATQVLVAAGKHGQAHIRAAAVLGLRELGNAESLAALQLLSNDPRSEVAQAAQAATAQLEKLLRGGRALSLRQMDSLISNHRILDKKRQPGKQIVSHVDYEDHFQKTTQRIAEIIYSQLLLRNAFPHLYCEDCLAHAEEQRYDEWEWVRCVQCKDAVSLVPGVVQVTGQIGGGAPWAVEEGHLRLSLWNPATHQARSAQVTRLEIIGGQALDYDWAVSAVVEKLRNAHPTDGEGVQVSLVGQPALSANSLQLLRTLDPLAGLAEDRGQIVRDQ